MTIRASDREASEHFYDTVLGAPGTQRPNRRALRRVGNFSLAKAGEGKPSTRRLHVGFAAPSREEVASSGASGTEAATLDGEQASAGVERTTTRIPSRSDGTAPRRFITAPSRRRYRPPLVRVAEVPAAKRSTSRRQSGGVPLEHDQRRERTSCRGGSFSVVKGEPTENVHTGLPRTKLHCVEFHRTLVEGLRDNVLPARCGLPLGLLRAFVSIPTETMRAREPQPWLTDRPSQGVQVAKALESWLARNTSARLRSGSSSPRRARAHERSYAEAVEVALCYGWIDGLVRRFDDDFYVQRFTPRTARSKWSKINTEKVTALIKSGAMKPAGMRQVEAAKADGRWDAAYDPPSRVAVPKDLQLELDKSPAAAEFFASLDSQNRYAILSGPEREEAGRERADREVRSAARKRRRSLVRNTVEVVDGVPDSGRAVSGECG